MKRVAFVVLLIGLSISSFSQGWELISPTPTFRNITGISFPTVATGFISDENYVYRTTDSGLNWHTLNVDTNITVTFNDVEFLNIYKGFALKVSGIYMTTDMGESWQFIAGMQANKLWFLNDNIGFAFGDNEAVYKTTDGGYTWNMIMSGQTYYTILDLEFSSPDTGYLVTGYTYNNQKIFTLRRTTDGGTTWTEVPTPALPYSISLVGSHLWLGTYKYSYMDAVPLWLYHTTNGGAAWDSVYVTEGPLNKRPQLLDEVRFFNPLEGYVCYYGKFYTTINGGATWLISDPSATYPNGCWFHNFSWVDPMHGFFCGGGGLAKTDDRAATFKRMGEGYNHYYWSAFWFFDMQHGIAAIPLTPGIAKNNPGTRNEGDHPYLVYTNDSARTWDTCNTPDLLWDVEDIKFANDSMGWAISDRLLATTDGGLNWTERFQDTQYPRVNLLKLCTPDANHIYNRAVHDIFFSSDGGYTWINRTPPELVSDYYATAMYFPEPLTGYCSGITPYPANHSILLRTTNGGVNWQSVAEGTGEIELMHFCDAANGVLSTGYKILITHDGGVTFVSHLYQHISYVKMFDPQTLLLVANSKVLMSYDGGITFIPIYNVYTPMWETGMTFPTDPDHGYALGFGAMIMRYDVNYAANNSPVIEVNRANPLFYPNPATTSILLAEPCSNCTITIYTIEGRPVLTIPGSSGPEIVISALPPGMYLVTLKGKDGRRVSKLVRM